MTPRVRDVIATLLMAAVFGWRWSFGRYGYLGWYELPVALAIAVLVSLVGGRMWMRKGRSESQGYFIGLVLFLFVGKFLTTWTFACFVAPLPTIVISLFLKANLAVLEARAMNAGMKRCPACDELVRHAATKCRFCGEALSVEAPTMQGYDPSKPEVPRDLLHSESSGRADPIQARLLAWSRPMLARARALGLAREHVLPRLRSVWTRQRAVVLAVGGVATMGATWLALRTTTAISSESQCREAFVQYLILGGGSRAAATRDADFTLGIYRCGSSGTYRGVRTLDQLARGGAVSETSETPLQIDLRRRMEEFFLARYPDGDEEVPNPSTPPARASQVPMRSQVANGVATHAHVEDRSPLLLDDAALVWRPSDVEHMLGKPTKTARSEGSGNIESDYLNGAVRVVFAPSAPGHEREVATAPGDEQQISTTRVVDATPEGLHVGLSEDAARALAIRFECGDHATSPTKNTCFFATDAKAQYPFYQRQTSFDLEGGVITRLRIETYTPGE